MKTTIFIISLSLLIYSCKKINSVMTEQVKDMKYDPNTSFELMLLSDFSYDNTTQSSTDYGTIKKILEKKIRQNINTKKYELIWLGVTSNNNNLTYVVRKKTLKNNILSIISRGTIFSLVDITEDAEVYKLVNWNDKVSPNIKISQGISYALQKTTSLTSKLFGLSNPINKELTLKELLSREITNNPNTTLYVAGHSLGGALTTGISIIIVENFYDYLQKAQLSLSAYNFAGQTIGNDFFKKYYDGYLSDTSISFSYNRVVNPFDVVPFAFNNLSGIEDIGYPYTKGALIEIKTLINATNILFSLNNKKYMHVGDAPIELEATLPPPNCKKTIENIKTFRCWIAYEHQSIYYVDLLKHTINN